MQTWRIECMVRIVRYRFPILDPRSSILELESRPRRPRRQSRGRSGLVGSLTRACQLLAAAHAPRLLTHSPTHPKDLCVCHLPLPTDIASIFPRPYLNLDDLDDLETTCQLLPLRRSAPCSRREVCPSTKHHHRRDLPSHCEHLPTHDPTFPTAIMDVLKVWPQVPGQHLCLS